MSWFSHVHRITNDRMVKKLYEWKPISTILAGRTKIRWKTDKKEDLRVMKIKTGQKASKIGLNVSSWEGWNFQTTKL